jgi:hypothetical protein
MKLPRTTIILALLLVGGGAFAQSRNGNNIPGPAEYSGFSRFITDRNIFDPNRQPHAYGTRTTRPRTRTTTRQSSSAPAFSLVGTMAYEKGYFAFFNGNSDELKKTMSAPGSIAGYAVTEITPGRAVLESADQKEKLELKVGDVMREENGKWELSGKGDLPSGRPAPRTSPETGASASAENNSTGGGGADAASTPAAAGEPNDILKKLMEKREQENQ